MPANTITQEDINNLLEETDFNCVKIGEKTTVVSATPPNGFVIVESSSCVDPKNYNHQLGIELCKKKIENKIWELEGYVLQCQNYWDRKLLERRAN